MNYPIYPNNSQYYMQSLQDMRNSIDSQMRQLQNQQNQPQQPTINQSFQLAPQTNTNELECKYANNIDEVKNTFVMKTGIFINKDFNSMWIKNTDGSIRTFKTEEIVELDDRDKEIINLKRQIQEMKEMIANESNVDNTIINEPNENKNTTKLSNNKRTNAK